VANCNHKYPNPKQSAAQNFATRKKLGRREELERTEELGKRWKHFDCRNIQVNTSRQNHARRHGAIQLGEEERALRKP